MENTLIKKIKSGKMEFHKLDKDQRSQRDVALAAVSKSGLNLVLVPSPLSSDDEIVKAAVVRTPGAILYVPKDHEHYRMLALHSLRQAGIMLTFLPKKIQDDKEMVLAAVAQDGDILELVAKKFQNDKQVVLAALQQNIHAEKFIGKALRKEVGAFPLQYLQREMLYKNLIVDLDAKTMQKQVKV